MDIKRYIDIQRKCTYDSNKFLRDSKESPDKFNLSNFFEYTTAERNIKTIYHSFSTNKIVGALQKDEYGKSILINSSASNFAQTLGKTHELSHDSFHLSLAPSQNFADGIENLYKGSQIKIEHEANTASMLYTIPDISLYSNLIEPRITFTDLLIIFNTEDWLLDRRLIRFLQINYQIIYEDAILIVNKFKSKSRFEKWSVLQDIVSMDIYSNTIISNFKDLNFFTQNKNVRSDFGGLSMSITI